MTNTTFRGFCTCWNIRKIKLPLITGQTLCSLVDKPAGLRSRAETSPWMSREWMSMPTPVEWMCTSSKHGDPWGKWTMGGGVPWITICKFWCRDVCTPRLKIQQPIPDQYSLFTASQNQWRPPFLEISASTRRPGPWGVSMEELAEIQSVPIFLRREPSFMSHVHLFRTYLLSF